MQVKNSLVALILCVPILGFCADEQSNFPADQIPVNTAKNVIATNKKTSPWQIEGRICGFRPQESVLREIYGERWADFQLLLGYRISSSWSIDLLGEYRERTGHSLGVSTRTKMWQYLITLEGRFHLELTRNIEFFVGGGPGYLIFRETLFIPGNKRHSKKEGFGGYGELGFLFHLTDLWTLDIFGAYSYYKFDFSSAVKNGSGATLQLGGIQAGIGLGCQF